jgi:ParB-like chromosome segregation protein Spo0J
MTTVKVADILGTLAGDQLQHLDPVQVEKYRRSVDHLPPIVVFETEEGLLLADGHHRLAAALAEGEGTIEVDMRTGTRQDALAYAVAVGAAQRGLPPDEVRKHLSERYGWSGPRGF